MPETQTSDRSTVVVPARASWVPRPTRSAALLVVIAAILELLGRLIESTGVTVAAAAALGAVISDAALTPRISGLIVTRTLPARLTAGVPTAVRLMVRSPDDRSGSRRPVVVMHDHPALSRVLIVTPQLRPGHEAVADPPSIAGHRGHWTHGGEITLEAFSPLGGFVRRCTLPVDEPLWVHPAPSLAMRLPEAAAGNGRGTSSSAQSGIGTEFFGIREWRSGDAANAVNWRASARRDKLVVTERELPAHSALIVVAGPGPVGDDARRQEHWETELARAASTAVIARRAGRTVALLRGNDVTCPSSASETLDWFAELESVPWPDSQAFRLAQRAAGGGAAWLWIGGAEGPPAAVVAAAGAARGRIASGYGPHR